MKVEAQRRKRLLNECALGTFSTGALVHYNGNLPHSPCCLRVSQGLGPFRPSRGLCTYRPDVPAQAGPENWPTSQVGPRAASVRLALSAYVLNWIHPW